MENPERVRQVLVVLSFMTVLGYFVLHCVALVSLTNDEKEDTDTGKSGIDKIIAVCGSSLRNMVTADTAVGTIGAGVYLLLAVIIVNEVSQKTSKVITICVMLAVYSFIMLMLGGFTLTAREDASKIPNCFETMGSPFKDPIRNTEDPMLAQVASWLGGVYILIGVVAFIGMVIYACVRSFCFPP